MRFGYPPPTVPTRVLPAYLAAACMMLAASSAPAFAASPWIASPQSRARVLDGGTAPDGTRRAGIEIELQQNAHTYWRNPGETGVPPELSTGGSGNLAEASLRFPAPTVIEEAGQTVFGYRERVILPIVVRAADPGKPVALSVDLAYATCADICVPGRLQAKLTLGAATTPTDEAALVAAAEARVPRPADAPGAPRLAARPLPAENGKPAWHLDVTPAESTADLFPEAPEPWFLTARRDPAGGFTLRADEAPKDAGAASHLAATLTFVGTSGSYEVRLDLDAAQPAP